jgi:tRNA pseudouridine38-40 synthase
LRIIPRARGLAFVVQADGFLYNMVRTIAGTLLEIGRGRLDPEAVDRALATGERTEAGPTAPPEGLYLVSVQYDETVFTGTSRFPRGRPGVFR